MAGEFRPEGILEVLERHRVRYVLIGGFAAAIHGSPYLTTDVDVTPATTEENLGLLSAALEELDARIRTAGDPYGLAFRHDAKSLARGSIWNLTTALGDLDISFVPSGTHGYEDLRRDATELDILGVRVPVASLADIIRSKQAADRPKDRLTLPVLRRILEEGPN